MRIAMIIRKLNVKGGTQRQMLSLARELKKRGHEVAVYAFSYDKEKCYPELLEGVRVAAAPESGRAGRGTFRSILRESRRAKLLAQVMDRNFDILNPHDQLSYRAAYYYKRLVRNIPSVWNMNDLPLHTWSYDKAQGVDPAFHRPLFRRLLYRLSDAYDAYFIRKQDRIIVVDFFNRGLVKKYLGLNAITVRNGPDLEHFSYRKRTPPRPPTIKLLTSGIFMPHRRFEDVIRAVKILEEQGFDPYLTIIGDYENDKKYHTMLTQLVTELHLGSRVRMAGRVSEKELVDAYHSHDLYLFPHHLQSDGLSPFEAAACGMPILVSRTAGSHELLTDRENGIVLDSKNPEDIATKVRDLLEHPALYAKLSEQGNRFVRENFSWEKYTDDVLKVFGEVVR